LESSLWEAADQIRANSKLTSSEYRISVLGVIFLRHATNRYNAALRQIEEDQAAGRTPKRPPIKADFLSIRSLTHESFRLHPIVPKHMNDKEAALCRRSSGIQRCKAVVHGRAGKHLLHRAACWFCQLDLAPFDTLIWPHPNLSY
jgi:hypothetical protein